MKIIIDTREQKPLNFEGHEIVRKKLDEGDYNVEELKTYIVIERKSLQDFYGSIIQGHTRFKNELLRSEKKRTQFYLFLEGTLAEFYSLKWSARRLHMRIPVLIKITTKTIANHNILLVECETREQMSKLILDTIETNKKIYGV